MTPVEEIATRAVENLLERPSGPMGFRFVIQPLMAMVIAIRDGIRDGRTGAPPYFLTILIPSDQQGPALKEGFRATARVMFLALLLDLLYQVYFLHTFHPGAALIIAFVLGFIPYIMFRGPVSRIVRRRHEQDRDKD